ncbi:uncharacterized protein MELLADRAFT_110160 [Melampsora larici-populina 98AG31]|uniref:Copper acquisition factor BIM1-like domain-containing protein n=1 Tax=Melampsora larici-populina (strain 98AG31 / pathotype 3-4-7) TaxID=747676 RepID=F4RYV9_MELLP|nr:uncharacterized protein MELLADRAFT_110160 [Melampsora larici-populina 98AG31]EGG02315.1 hypothetical protein MELLADRAFT_110160 [Melampsora larici-populina 98AG31]
MIAHKSSPNQISGRVFIYSGLLITLLLQISKCSELTLLYPPPRNNKSGHKNDFCGGYLAASSHRTQFPLSGAASVIVDVDHNPAKVAISLSLSPDPKSLKDFETNGQMNYLLPLVPTHGEGHYCFNVDVSSLPKLSPKNGTLATLQVAISTHHGREYQCTDIILTKEANTPKVLRCSNPPMTGSPMSSDSIAEACTFKHLFPECSRPKAKSNAAVQDMISYLKIVTGILICTAILIQ